MQPQGDLSNAPRTAIGFSEDRKTMYLAVADGRQTQVLGPRLAEMGALMQSIGADDAINLDGGGSSTLVARPLGGTDATVRNTPSDGSERATPNGVGIFLAQGSGVADQLLVSSSGEQARVFPGLHRSFGVKAVDENGSPVALAARRRALERQRGLRRRRPPEGARERLRAAADPRDDRHAAGEPRRESARRAGRDRALASPPLVHRHEQRRRDDRPRRQRRARASRPRSTRPTSSSTTTARSSPCSRRATA